jgi:hypothetical protein
MYLLELLGLQLVQLLVALQQRKTGTLLQPLAVRAQQLPRAVLQRLPDRFSRVNSLSTSITQPENAKTVIKIQKCAEAHLLQFHREPS